MHATSGVKVRDDPSNLTELYNEARLILPGTQVFLAFLMTLPFTSRFEGLDRHQRLLFLATFFSTLGALACFVAPAAYHRIARPIRNKARFKELATVFIVLGLAPLSISVVTTTYLVTSVVSPSHAEVSTGAIGVLVVLLWWVVPLLRIHDRFAPRERNAGHAAE